MSATNRNKARRYALAFLSAALVAVTLISVESGEGPAAATGTQEATGCESLKAVQIPAVTLNVAEPIPAGAYQPPGSTQSFPDLPAFCRVTATITDAPGSSIGVEVWLPSEDWNGRYTQVGTHGLGGTIDWNEMAPQLRRGFATAATDSGHAGTGRFDSSWAIGSPARLTDFAWRSVHELVVNAKTIIARYYRRPAAYAYYAGSSTGGRDGMKSAQMFPHDFDGILAGAAIQDFTRAATQMLVTSRRLAAAGFQGSQGAALLALVQRSAVAACDGADGVLDNIISDPRTCHWNPHEVMCRTGQDPNTCLSKAEADAVAASVAPLTDPVTHKVLFTGEEISSQVDWISFILNPVYSLAVYRMGLNDPSWDGSTFDLHKDLASIEERLDPVNATDPDLSAFEAAGGKIIQYQGWEDGVAYSQSVVDYYDAVRDRTAQGDRLQQQGFYRLFMVPGVSHTGAGTGAYSFGQDTLRPLSGDPGFDAMAALQDWVEKGTAPSRFTATKYVNNDPAQGIATQRLLCPYPSEAVYRGTGDPKDPGNFTCETPARYRGDEK